MSGKTVHTEQELDLVLLLRNFCKLLWRHWWFPVVLALVFGATMYVCAWSRYTPMYRAEVSTTVMVSASSDSDNYGFYYDSSAANQLADTFPYILGSSLLMDALRSDLGVEVVNGSLGVDLVEGSNLLTLSVTSSDPEDARDILESVLRVYPDVARVVIGNIEFHLIDTPTVPSQPYNFPDYVHIAARGCVVGACVGLALLAGSALWNRKIYGTEQLRAVSNMVCLGKISAMGRRRAVGSIPCGRSVPAAVSDEFNSLSLSVQRELGETNGKVLMVTSTVAGEGKSVVAEHLAYALAQQGKRVILVDGDLRKQSMWEQLGAQGSCGLREMTLEGTSAENAMEWCEGLKFYFVGGRGAVPSVPLVLNAEEMEAVWGSLKQMVDYVVLDTPPALLFDDATLLSRFVDGVLYVVRHDWVQRYQLVDALAHLGEAHAKILGYVYNAQPRTHSRYGYGYAYGYGGYGYGRSGSKRG